MKWITFVTYYHEENTHEGEDKDVKEDVDTLKVERKKSISLTPYLVQDKDMNVTKKISTSHSIIVYSKNKE